MSYILPYGKKHQSLEQIAKYECRSSFGKFLHCGRYLNGKGVVTQEYRKNNPELGRLIHELLSNQVSSKKLAKIDKKWNYQSSSIKTASTSLFQGINPKETPRKATPASTPQTQQTTDSVSLPISKQEKFIQLLKRLRNLPEEKAIEGKEFERILAEIQESIAKESNPAVTYQMGLLAEKEAIDCRDACEDTYVDTFFVIACFCYEDPHLKDNPQALCRLGQLYENSHVEPRNNEHRYDLAKSYYKKAADAGDLEATFLLGKLYDMLANLGVDKDENYKEAFKLIKQTADSGHPKAQVHLGNMYENGDGVLRNYSKAFEYYKMAAEKGDAEGQYFLGCCYERGLGTPKSDSEKTKWYQMAADQDLPLAKEKLGL